eukprot:1113845-Rhodomonas_salina.2
MGAAIGRHFKVRCLQWRADLEGWYVMREDEEGACWEGGGRPAGRGSLRAMRRRCALPWPVWRRKRRMRMRMRRMRRRRRWWWRRRRRRRIKGEKELSRSRHSTHAVTSQGTEDGMLRTSTESRKASKPTTNSLML